MLKLDAACLQGVTGKENLAPKVRHGARVVFEKVDGAHKKVRARAAHALPVSHGR
jgi:hypothetical protein